MTRISTTPARAPERPGVDEIMEHVKTYAWLRASLHGPETDARCAAEFERVRHMVINLAPQSPPAAPIRQEFWDDLRDVLHVIEHDDCWHFLDTDRGDATFDRLRADLAAHAGPGTEP